MKTKHQGIFDTCPYCVEFIRYFSITKLRVISRHRNLHNAAIARRDRDQAYRDCGMIKVRGSLGGTYWE